MCSKQRRHRDPVPPTFSLPPRGLKCKNWLKFAKRELKLRMKSLHEQRAKVIEIIINGVISIVIIDAGNDLLSFKLRSDAIIDGLINEFKSKLLDSWKGPQFRSDSWKTKKWEGKNGYYKLCKNWSDQNKSKIAHNFWIPVFIELTGFIHQISHHQYRNNQILQNALKSCLMYSCFYAISSSKIAFPKTRALPLFLETAMAKNRNIRQYLKEFDDNLHIYRFREEESEQYNRERRICQAVKQRCIQYIGETVQKKSAQFYQMINLHGNINKFNLEQFEFTIKFDTNGQIGRSQQCKNEMDDDKTEESFPSLLPPSIPSIPSIIPELHSLDNNITNNINNNYLSAECEVLSYCHYSASHGSTNRVEQSRYTPFAPQQPIINNHHYEEEECCCNIPIYYNNNNNQIESRLSSDSYNSFCSHCSSLSGSSSSYIPEYNGNMNGNTNMNQTVYNHYHSSYDSYPYTLQSHHAPGYQYN